MAPAYKAHAGSMLTSARQNDSHSLLDVSPRGAWLTLKEYMTPEEFQKVLNGQWRVRIITVWRPLVAKVEDCPLAFCSKPSLEESDCVAYDRVDGSTPGEGVFLSHNPGQKWFWLSDQTWDEVFIFESWDSQGEGLQGQCHGSGGITSRKFFLLTSLNEAHTFHCAFQEFPNVHVVTRRRSVETRTMVIYGVGVSDE